ncbi:MAG: FeoB-associated Cys-rich membrane protein [Clostridia bacterium]|nr:FeoB-associated Cys-rich membrane protein [Clostridia bacterium]MDE7328278.1 FeoB-associated Cys-rich membrane protein [Clostridia bacterium]
MILTLAVDAIEVIVGVVVALVVVGGFGLYLYRKIKAKKSGKGGCCCSGDCCSCSGCSVSFKKKDKTNDQNDKSPLEE